LKVTRTLVVLFVVAAFVAACGGSSGAGGGGGGSETAEPSEAAATGLCANIYFPVVDGATFTYAGTGPTGDYTYTSTVSNVHENGFTFTHQFDDLTATQEWSCSEEGIAALDYGGGPEATLSTSGLNGTFETTSTTGVSVPRDLDIGDTWTQSFVIEGNMEFSGQTATSTGNVTQTYTAVREESVSVPAGTFNAVVVEGTNTFELQISLEGGITVPVTFAANTTSWWVANVGWVKSESSVSTEGSESFGGSTELVSYSIP
jgi:hypothetical protein